MYSSKTNKTTLFKLLLMSAMAPLSRTFEGFVEAASKKTRPYFGVVGRFLLISTFLEDFLRIYMHWSSQMDYMTEYREWPYPISFLFLGFCMIGMLIGSILAWFRPLVPLACALLGSVVTLQTIGYGLFTYIPFIFRNLSLLGALSLLYCESINSTIDPNDQRRRHGLQLPGLPEISPVEKGRYISLFGRIMLVMLFATLFSEYDAFSVRSFALTLTAITACILIAVGYKATYSAVLLICLLCVSNVVFNQWWTLDHGTDDRDFKRYDFFQTLSIIGGFLILAQEGPGGISLEKKKDY